MGFDARVMAAHLVAPYRMQGKGGKNDATEAAAMGEAASRPTMHFVLPGLPTQSSVGGAGGDWREPAFH